MASLLPAVLFCAFMATVSLFLLHDVAAREMAETRTVVSSSGGSEEGVSVDNMNWRRYFSRRGREANEVRGLCEYEPRYITYCCHIDDDVPLCYSRKYDCLNNCFKEAPPAKH